MSVEHRSVRHHTATIRSRDAGRAFAGRPPAELYLVFDGYCGFCTRSIRWIRQIDRHDRITTLAGQAEGTFARTAVSPADAERASWAITTDGRRIAGAPAIGLAVSVALGSRIPMLAWRLPGVSRILDRVYRWIADNRRRFRGDQPWCQAAGAGRCTADR